MRFLFALAILPVAVMAQHQDIEKAGACSRCHISSVLEWSISKHSKVNTGCEACHGPSKGHVADEQNGVKPDWIQRDKAVDGLCITCHSLGCPKTSQTASCQVCHHSHALVNPTTPPAIAETPPSPGRAPQVSRPPEGLLPGFETVGNETDKATGLAKHVKVASVGMQMFLVPGGHFDMGSEQWEDARPVHTVDVEPFYLARFELTQAEWKTLMGENPSMFQGSEFPDADQMPVEQVSWEDARILVQAINKRVAGGGFRLPTEAEWEYAARAGAIGHISRDALPRVAWFADNSAQNHEKGREADDFLAVFAPHPVGSLEPNSWGFFDMIGNVAEWCSSLARTYPFDESDGRESLDGQGPRILRGGSFVDSADSLDIAMRHSARPQRHLRWNGVRLARSIVE